jgi:hypothetical protein
MKKAQSAWATGGVIKRIADLYEEHGFAGGIRYSTGSNAGWTEQTIKRLFPNGFERFFAQYVMHFVVYGEMYILPTFDIFNRPVGIKTIHPIEVLQVEYDEYEDKLYLLRQWISKRVQSQSDTIVYESFNNRQVYDSDSVFCVKWNSVYERGHPFVYPILAWDTVYSEWLKDRAVANRVRGFAYLIKKILKHGGAAASIADQFESKLMTNVGYTPGSHTNYGYGYKTQKMPHAGILQCDEFVEWDVLQFKIDGDGASPDGEKFRQQICTLTGIPETLLFLSSGARADTADANIESMVKKIEGIRKMFELDLNALLQHIRRIELDSSADFGTRIAGRKVNTVTNLKWKPGYPGERRFLTKDLNEAVIGGHISIQTAQDITPFCEDPEEERKRIAEESKDPHYQDVIARLAKKGGNDKDDENTDMLKKQKDGDAGVRHQEYETSKKSGEET